MEIFVDGTVYILDDFRKLTAYGDKKHNILSTKVSNKGQKELLQNFAKAIYGKRDFQIPIWQQLQAMDIAFRVDDAIHGKAK